MIVVKFGGSLLMGAKDYLTAAKKVAELREVDDVIVVVSAMKGITSRLINLISSENPESELTKVFSEHLEESDGRIRWSECSERELKYLVLGSNTVRGAAGAAVLIAELLKVEGYI